MKIILTTLNAKYIHSSLALRYLKAYCRGEFPDISLMEFSINDQLSLVVGEIYKSKPDIIGFSCYIWNFGQIITIAGMLKKVLPQTRIILGGPEVSYDPNDILDKHPFIDFVIAGEGEEAFLKFLQALQAGQNFSEVPGLSYRDNHEVHLNGQAQLIKQLDSIPSPYQDNLEDLANKIVYYESSRGCPFSCQYCLSSTLSGVRFFSLNRVKEDLNKLINSGVKQVKFVDRTFNCRKEHALEIFEFLAGFETNVNFHFEIAADLLDEDYSPVLSKVPPGLFQFEIGVQSTNRETLKLIDRVMDLNMVAANVAFLRRNNNIHLHLDLIAGLPGEDYKSFRRSFNEVYGMKPHQLQLGFLKVMKGSGVRQRADEFGLIYNSEPPYEILQSKDISYGQLLKLKTIEDLVEKYPNSQRFTNSLEFMIHHYLSPFDFYEDLAEYWEARGYHRQSHSIVRLFEILDEFFIYRGFQGNMKFRHLMKFDFLLFEQNARLPKIFEENESPVVKERIWEFLKNPENISKYLEHLRDLPAKEIIKKVRFESFSGEKTLWYLFDYTQINPVNGGARFYRINL